MLLQIPNVNDVKFSLFGKMFRGAEIVILVQSERNIIDNNICSGNE